MGDLQWFNLSTLTIKKDMIEKQYDFAYTRYIEEIKKFFSYVPYKVFFPVEELLNKNNPVLTIVIDEEIPPRLMFRFCEEFGYYSPTVEYHEITIGGLRTYKFTKKVEWEYLNNITV